MSKIFMRLILLFGLVSMSLAKFVPRKLSEATESVAEFYFYAEFESDLTTAEVEKLKILVRTKYPDAFVSGVNAIDLRCTVFNPDNGEYLINIRATPAAASIIESIDPLDHDAFASIANAVKNGAVGAGLPTLTRPRAGVWRVPMSRLKSLCLQCFKKDNGCNDDGTVDITKIPLGCDTDMFPDYVGFPDDVCVCNAQRANWDCPYALQCLAPTGCNPPYVTPYVLNDDKTCCAGCPQCPPVCTAVDTPSGCNIPTCTAEATPYDGCDVPDCTAVATPYDGCNVQVCTDVDKPYVGCAPGDDYVLTSSDNYKKCRGNQIGDPILNVETDNACKQLCNEQVLCQGFFRIPKGSQPCMLFDKCNSLKKSRKKGNVYKQTDVYVRTSDKWKKCVEKKLGSILNVKTVNACKEHCNEEVLCKAFFHIPRGDHPCILYEKCDSLISSPEGNIYKLKDDYVLIPSDKKLKCGGKQIGDPISNVKTDNDCKEHCNKQVLCNGIFRIPGGDNHCMLFDKCDSTKASNQTGNIIKKKATESVAEFYAEFESDLTTAEVENLKILVRTKYPDAFVSGVNAIDLRCTVVNFANGKYLINIKATPAAASNIESIDPLDDDAFASIANAVKNGAVGAGLPTLTQAGAGVWRATMSQLKTLCLKRFKKDKGCNDDGTADITKIPLGCDTLVFPDILTIYERKVGLPDVMCVCNAQRASWDCPYSLSCAPPTGCDPPYVTPYAFKDLKDGKTCCAECPQCPTQRLAQAPQGQSEEATSNGNSDSYDIAYIVLVAGSSFYMCF